MATNSSKLFLALSLQMLCRHSQDVCSCTGHDLVSWIRNDDDDDDDDDDDNSICIAP